MYRSIALGVMLTLLLTAVEAAPVVKAVPDEAGLRWVVKGAYGSAALVITGPDDYRVERRFAVDETLAIGIAELADDVAFADGRYDYELVLSPALTATEAALLAELRAADIEVDMEALGLAQGTTLSGTFTADAGGLINPARPEPVSQAKDVVILDDQIVDGSLCVGLDCVGGETFGDATILLKENNVRVRFDDSSTTGSFPSTDWQLTANDSINGGAGRFSIEDLTAGTVPVTIEAGAPSNALYVDDRGRVGVRTATPVVELHTVDGDTPTLRLEQNGSSGFAPQTWDVAGNETNFFVRDVTNGSTLPFRVRPGASTDSLRIEATGSVLMGGADNAEVLRLERAGPVAIALEDTDVGMDWTIGTDASGNLVIALDGTPLLTIDQTGNATFAGTVDAAVGGSN